VLPKLLVSPCVQIQWRALDEINAGVCDGMTYDEIKKSKPEEYEYVNSLISWHFMLKIPFHH
jgi:broad specificity phosphatase PhoE